jgi:ABC-type antimicrobial peptide transport system permease subunit
MISTFQLAFLSLTRHRLTSLIAIISVTLAIACCGLLLRIHKLSESRFETLGSGGDSIVGAKSGGADILLSALNSEGGYPDYLPQKLFDSLKAQQFVQHGDGVVTSSGYIKNIIPILILGYFDKYRVLATDDSFYSQRLVNNNGVLSVGRLPGKIDEVVVGAAVAKSKGLSLGSRVQMTIWIDDERPSQHTLDVVGILKPTRSNWDINVYVDLATSRSLLLPHIDRISKKSIWGTDVLHYFLVDLAPGSYDEFASLINKRTVGQAIHISTEKDKLNQLYGAGQKIGLLISFVVILLASLCIGSLLTARFDNMRTQIAVLRALGYGRLRLMSWWVWESVIIGVLGILLGILFDMVTFPYVRQLLGSSLPPAELVHSSVFLSYPVWIAAFGSILLSVLFPLWVLVSRDVHSQLRGF